VPVLITKALIEIPPKFAGRPPVSGSRVRQRRCRLWATNRLLIHLFLGFTRVEEREAIVNQDEESDQALGVGQAVGGEALQPAVLLEVGMPPFHVWLRFLYRCLPSGVCVL